MRKFCRGARTNDSQKMLCLDYKTAKLPNKTFAIFPHSPNTHTDYTFTASILASQKLVTAHQPLYKIFGDSDSEDYVIHFLHMHHAVITYFRNGSISYRFSSTSQLFIRQQHQQDIHTYIKLCGIQLCVNYSKQLCSQISWAFQLCRNLMKLMSQHNFFQKLANAK